jgi:cation:H+ antiporter
VTPLVVGLTVVALGTSAPEMMTSVYSQWIGQGSVAIGNVIGSNIFNVFAILGLSAVVAPLAVDTNLLKLDVPLVIIVSIVVLGFAYSGTIGRWESALLAAGLVAYLCWVVTHSSSSESPPVVEELQEATEVVSPASQHWSVLAVLTLVGLGLIILGGRLFVSGAVDLARTFDVSESVIGLTIVAAGTSMPELVTSMLASYRGHRDIAVGNVVGSNLFNLLGVLGISGLVGAEPLAVEEKLLTFDLPIMIVGALVCLPMMASGGRLERWEGAILVAAFLTYVTYLVIEQAGFIAAV